MPNDLVVGPALMALVHISLYNELKPEIVLAGALPIILKHLVYNKSKPIIAQSCKLCASLAIYRPNKSEIANSGCLHALFDLVLGAHTDVDKYVQYECLCGLVNLMCDNDSNRLLSVELNGIRPILTLLSTCSHENIIIQSIKVLANISYGNGYCANSVLKAGGGEIMVEILESGDIFRQPAVASAIFAAFANLCNTETNQTFVGSTKGIVECAVKVCEFARDINLVSDAANFLLACCLKNSVNKARIANHGGCAALLKRIIRHGTVKNQNDVACTEKLCFALSSTLLYNPTHERMNVIGGFQEIVRLCKVITEPSTLRGLSQILVSMIPQPDELLRLHNDDSKHISESTNAIHVLKKAKFQGFSNSSEPPQWIEYAIRILSSSDEELKEMTLCSRNEYVDQKEVCKEFLTEILPDATIYSIKEYKGLLFSIY
jgi:hypothetical protein